MKENNQTVYLDASRLFRGCLFSLPVSIVFWVGLYFLIRWIF
jgi:hypothetical protein